MKGSFVYELSRWNDTARAFPAQERCLHELVEEQARRTPEADALAFEGERLSYAELEWRAQLLAARLRSLGAGPETVVGVLAGRSQHLVVALLAILKSGAAYLPIDTAYPRERIAFMLADAGAIALVADSSLAELAPPALKRVELDRFDWSGRAEPLDESRRARSRNLAYVIYTSGSTGRPKGVAVEHRSIVNYVLGIADRLRLEPGMQHASVSTIAADLGNTVVFPALATGGCLHLLSQERCESARLAQEYFAREAIDVLKIVPSHLAALQVMPRRRLVLGGETSRGGEIERLRQLAPQCEIHNHYGPTETTVGVLTCQAEDPLPRPLPLGKPLPNCRVYILDAEGAPLPAGEKGELCIGGLGVARGYLGRDELTAEKFVPDPFYPDSEARMYRSGDLARYLPDGNVEFCGRIDHQVKINGHRVEPGEIEAALRESRGVRDAVVVAREGSGGTQLCAYVVPWRADQPLWHAGAVHLLADGSPVAHLNRSETDYIYNEIFVLQAYLRHGITIRDGDCIVDAGANIGLFTVFASRVARDLRILAFEPNPAAHACLSANARAWGSAARCLPLGLSREDGSARLTFFEGLSLLSGFYADAAKERSVVATYVQNQQGGAQPLERELGELIDQRMKETTVTAELRTLSRVIAEQNLERIDLLKINVEKSELDVLLGIAAADWPKIAQLVIEVDESANLAPITRLLGEHGYDVLVEQDPLLKKTDLCYVYAVRRDDPRRRLTAESAQVALSPADEQILAPSSLRARLKASLPRHMIPSSIVLLDELPLTANGKIDRAALPAPGRDAPAVRPAARAPTPTEKSLAAIWCALLEVTDIGPEDDFFDLGGQSLLAMQAVVRIREAFGVELPLRNLFEAPTLAGLAEAIDRLLWASAAARQDRGEAVEEIAL